MRFLFGLTFSIALCISASANAVTITNVTTNTVLFSDNFESVSPVSSVPAIDSSGDYDPATAPIGTWQIVAETNPEIVQVTNSTAVPDPGPARGSKYLRIYRDIDHASHEVNALATATQHTGGDLIRLSTMVYVPNDGANARGQIALAGAITGAGWDFQTATAWVRPDGNGNVVAIGPLLEATDTGVDYTPGAWQQWDLEYVIGTRQFTVSVNGVSSGTLTNIFDGGVAGAVIFNGSNTPGSIYFDAVPGSGPVVPGDFDSDGDVDGADFVVWQTHFPTASGATLADGDADADGDVDGADFVVWQTNFPFTPSPAVAPVPEPAGITLVSAAACILVSLCRKRPMIARNM